MKSIQKRSLERVKTCFLGLAAISLKDFSVTSAESGTSQLAKPIRIQQEGREKGRKERNKINSDRQGKERKGIEKGKERKFRKIQQTGWSKI